jgi:hypothetical protein
MQVEFSTEEVNFTYAPTKHLPATLTIRNLSDSLVYFKAHPIPLSSNLPVPSSTYLNPTEASLTPNSPSALKSPFTKR